MSKIVRRSPSKERSRFRVYVNEVSDDSGDSYELLRQQGIDVRLGRPRWEDPGHPMSEDELIEQCRDVDAVIGVSRDFFTRRFMESCPRLRIISKVGVGTEKIDVEAATELGVLVGFTPIPENTKAVAEHAVTLMVALSHTLPALERHLREGGWRGPEIHPRNLFGKTVGLIGFGRIAREVAARLGGWDVRIIATDPYVAPSDATALGVELLAFDEVLAKSDLISVHVVATPETTSLLGREEFAKMRPGAIIVNTSRGQVMDEDALAEAIALGHIGAAGLDVFRSEPPDLAHPLFSLANVIVTPHASGFADESVRANSVAAARNVIAASRGEDPPLLKNPEALPRWHEHWT